MVVSRGQLVEIGGSFRLPEVFEVSGARLREVGTTNKTRLSDYADAIGPETAALLRVHASNYRIVGFTEAVPLAELTALAHARGLWAIDDIGSGALAAGMPPGVAGEPTVAEGLAAGADLVLFSGDKLLGGPQCGLLLGSRLAIARVEADPLMRALRVDKMTLAALEATLQLALDADRAGRHIPLWRFLNTPLAQLQARAEALAATFRDELGLNASVVEDRGLPRRRQPAGRADPDGRRARRAPLPRPPRVGGGLGAGPPPGRSAGRPAGPARRRPVRPARPRRGRRLLCSSRPPPAVRSAAVARGRAQCQWRRSEGVVRRRVGIAGDLGKRPPVPPPRRAAGRLGPVPMMRPRRCLAPENALS